jgi:hypothetical protein
MELPSIHGIFDNIVADLIFRVGAVVVAYMVGRRIGKERYLSPSIIFLVIVGIYGLLMFAWNQTVAFRRERAQMVTTRMSNEELADTIRKWMDDFSMQVQKENRNDAYLSFIIRGGSGFKIVVMRLKNVREQFITLICAVSFGNEVQAKLSSLSEQQRSWVYSEIATELMRQKTNSAMDFPRGIELESRVALTDLTQAKLIERIDDLDYTVSLVRLKLKALLNMEIKLIT